MQKFCFEVNHSDRGLRLDQYIIKNLDCDNLGLSRAQIQRLIKSADICVKGKSVKAHYKVKERDIILINLPEQSAVQALPERIPLEIIFEDDDILIVNKPAGMVTHPAAGNYTHTLVNALLNYGCSLSSVNGPLRPGIVHRLDKDTSGLIVVAKNNSAHQNLAKQFRKHSVKRRYIALVRGKIEHNEGKIDLPIGRHARDRQKMTVRYDQKGRSALTRYKVLKRFRDMTVLELAPHTGRTHQLRVHLKHCGHPILGDNRYGGNADFPRMALHAKLLGFVHPRTKRLVEFESRLPECFSGKI